MSRIEEVRMRDRRSREYQLQNSRERLDNAWQGSGWLPAYLRFPKRRPGRRTLEKLWNVTEAALEKRISLPRLWEDGGALMRALQSQNARKNKLGFTSISILKACEDALDYIRGGEVEVKRRINVIMT